MDGHAADDKPIVLTACAGDCLSLLAFGEEETKMERKSGKRSLLRNGLIGLLAVIMIFSLAGCSLQGSAAQSTGGERTVSLQVVEGPGGAVLALVPIYINDHGPYAFALDTGASRSLIDLEIVKELNLQVVGSAGEVTGISGGTQADVVRVDNWRAGDVSLPSTDVITLELPSSDRKHGLRGLLGSDILSQYGSITIEYQKQLLILRSRDESSEQTSHR